MSILIVGSIPVISWSQSACLKAGCLKVQLLRLVVNRSFNELAELGILEFGTVRVLVLLSCCTVLAIVLYSVLSAVSTVLSLVCDCT